MANGADGTNQMAAYGADVAAYHQALGAYIAYADAVKRSPGTAAYELVVKDTIATIFGQMILGFLGYAFVKSGAGLIDNMTRVKHGEPPAPLTLFP